MSSLKKRIIDDMKLVIKAQDKPRLKAIRMIISAIKQKEIDERIELNDSQVLHVIEKMTKQRKDSISQFAAANRDDLVAIEQSELAVISHYMPPQMSPKEITDAVTQAITDTNATSMQDMGKLMALLKPQLAGKADMSAVSQQIKNKLG